MNVVDVSCSFAWWDWARWRTELDWMALHGVNLALAYTGQEAVYKRLYERHNLTDADMGVFFNGPAFLSWSRGQGQAGVGGPLPTWWYAQQAVLNRQILSGMNALGITPILPGFQGNVPKALHAVYPAANISSDGWLDALDPLFPVLADEYMGLLIEEFGANEHFYQADGLFSASKAPWYGEGEGESEGEGAGANGPLSVDPDAAKRSAAAFGGMARTDPDATWVYQTWIWRSYGASKLPFLRGWISAVPPGRLLLLDQTAERLPLWSAFDDYAFFNTSFVWCAMHEMGGNVGLFGDLQTVADGPVAAHGSGVLGGVGIDPEGIDQNPAYYEMALEAAWRDETIDVAAWVAGGGGDGGAAGADADAVVAAPSTGAAAGSSWAAQRCGTAGGSVAANAAWVLLGRTVYAHNSAQHYEHHMKYCPTAMPAASKGTHWSTPVVRPSWYDPADLHKAWGLLLDAAEAGACTAPGETAPTPSFGFDIVDVGREYLSVAPCLAAYDALGAAAGSMSAAAAAAASASMSAVLQDLDRLLLAAPTGGFLLGRWIRAARALAPAGDGASADLLEMNARAQVTSWFPVNASQAAQGKVGGLYDYANKAWGGLVAPYYLKRYALYADAVAAGAAKGAKAVDAAAYEAELARLAHDFAYGTKWANGSATEPAEPVGDAVAIARELWHKYAPPS